MSNFPNSGRLLLTQTRYQLVTFWRIPVAMFFTLALPLLLLLVVNALFGNETIETDEGTWSVSQFYTGGLAAFTAVSATYTNIANMVPIRRDEGVLKRWRGTPLPTWTYIGGFVLSAVAIAFVGVILMLGLGVVLYDLEIVWAKMPAAAVSFTVGVSSFAALGMAVAALVKTASSASAVANATILPLAFISNVFIISEGGPAWIETLGNIFPLRPFVESMQGCFTPFVEPPAFNWDKLAFVALWGVAGLLVAVRRFTWEPSATAAAGRRNRRSGDVPL